MTPDTPTTFDFNDRTDQAWIRQLKQNETETLDALWQMLYVFAWNLVKKKSLPLDIVQDGAVAAYKRISERGINQYRFHCPFPAFCQRIVINECYRLITKNQLTLVTYQEEYHQQIAPEPEVQPSSERVQARLDPCWQKLPERERTILEHFYFKGDTPEQIAQLLDITRNYVNQLAYRARAKLKKCLEKHGFHSADAVLGL